MLHIGITGKIQLWQALDETQSARLAQFDLPALVKQAESQRARVERLRLDAGREAFTEEPV
jgi:hypothetical protein